MCKRLAFGSHGKGLDPGQGIETAPLFSSLQYSVARNVAEMLRVSQNWKDPRRMMQDSRHRLAHGRVHGEKWERYESKGARYSDTNLSCSFEQQIASLP